MKAKLIELQFCNLRDTLYEIMNGLDTKFTVTVYFHGRNVSMAGYYGDNVTARENLENRALSSCRESIEWHYGELGRLLLQR